MVRLLLLIVVWLTAIGFITFLTLYLIFASPWRDRMGKHVLVFTGSLTIAFVYSIISPMLFDINTRLFGWLIVMSFVSTAIWLTTALLIRYQIQSRKEYKLLQREKEGF